MSRICTFMCRMATVQTSHPITAFPISCDYSMSPVVWQYQSGWRHWYLANPCSIEQDLGHGIPWTSQIRISLRWKEHKGTTLGTTLGTVGVEIDIGPSSMQVVWAHRTLLPGVLAPSSRTRRDAAPFRQGDPRKDGMAHRDANGAVRLVHWGCRVAYEPSRSNGAKKYWHFMALSFIVENSFILFILGNTFSSNTSTNAL